MSASRAPHRGAAESGVAMIVLLLVALFVALVGVAMMSDTVGEVRIAGNESTAVEARYAAEAGIAAAAAQLAVANTWTGPLTQSIGADSFTVQVDSTRSNTALKVIVSTGYVRTATPAGGQQTVTATFLVLPQAFTKAALSNTTVATCAAATCDTGGYTPTIGNSVLRQLGTIHANNVVTATTAVNIVANTEVVGQITARRGNVTPTTSPMGTCIACASTTNEPTIPFPSFNFTHYQTLATSNGTFFASSAAFDTYVTGLTADASGFRTINGVVFINTSNSVNIPNTAAEQKLRINGSLIIWATGPFGDFVLNWAKNPFTLILNSQSGEPALVVGGSIFEGGSVTTGSLTINGLVYVLDYTNNPTANPTCPGVDLPGSSTSLVTIKGMVVAQNLGCAGTAGGLDMNSLTYDPSSFFAGLPSGLVTPTQPFVLLPISWSSAK